MAGPEDDGDTLIKVKPRKPAKTLPVKRARNPGRRPPKAKVDGRGTKADIMAWAMRRADETENKPLILLESTARMNKSVAAFFPGTPGNSLELLEIVAEVLRTYQKGGGDIHNDLAEIRRFLKIKPGIPKSARELLPKRGQNMFADDRAHLTAAALLLLLSWVQRKRHQILEILMEFRAPNPQIPDGVGSKMKRLQEALEEFLVGPESLRDNSKKSGGA